MSTDRRRKDSFETTPKTDIFSVSILERVSLVMKSLSLLVIHFWTRKTSAKTVKWTKIEKRQPLKKRMRHKQFNLPRFSNKSLSWTGNELDSRRRSTEYLLQNRFLCVFIFYMFTETYQTKKSRRVATFYARRPMGTTVAVGRQIFASLTFYYIRWTIIDVSKTTTNGCIIQFIVRFFFSQKLFNGTSFGNSLKPKRGKSTFTRPKIKNINKKCVAKIFSIQKPDRQIKKKCLKLNNTCEKAQRQTRSFFPIPLAPRRIKIILKIHSNLRLEFVKPRK